MDDKTVKNAFKLNKVLWNYNAKKKKQKDTKKQVVLLMGSGNL